MPRIAAKEVEVTLDNGKVLHFIKSAGDTVVVDHVVTRLTGTPINHPDVVEYYTLILGRNSTLDEVHEKGV